LDTAANDKFPGFRLPALDSLQYTDNKQFIRLYRSGAVMHHMLVDVDLKEATPWTGAILKL